MQRKCSFCFITSQPGPLLYLEALDAVDPFEEVVDTFFTWGEAEGFFFVLRAAVAFFVRLRFFVLRGVFLFLVPTPKL
jgi:hypothetical protein